MSKASDIILGAIAWIAGGICFVLALVLAFLVVAAALTLTYAIPIAIIILTIWVITNF